MAQPTSVSRLDAELWKTYNAELRKYVFGGGKLDAKTQAFYVTPIGWAGLPAGPNIPEPVTNMSIFRVADTLQDVNNPVFIPGSGDSYINRQSRYLNATQFKNNTNMGAARRLQDAEKKLQDLQQKMAVMEVKARQAFEADADKPDGYPFKSWVSRQYPNYDSLNSEVQQAASARNAAMIEVYGPAAQELTRKISNIEKARNQNDQNPSNNMQVSSQPANAVDGATLDTATAKQYRPFYSISKDYTDAVRQWIGESDSRPVNLSISTTPNSSRSWEDSGFPKSGTSIGTRYSFISARIKVDNSEKEEDLALEQLGSEITITLRATGIKKFDVKAGSWDGDFANLFKGTSLKENTSFPAACAVSQVVVGHNVSLDVTLSSSAATLVNDLYSRVNSTGGSFSIFGIPIGTDAQREASLGTSYTIKNNQNNFGSFSIAGDDKGNPVVLGAIGRKLPRVGS